MKRIIPYKPKLVQRAKELRNNMTLGEVALWREIKGSKLDYKFSRQIPIDNYIVDFYCKELLLAIEVDGGIHFEEEQIEKDFKRNKRLKSFGITIVRFSDLDVRHNLPWVIEEIKVELEKIKPTPCPSQEGISSKVNFN